MRTPVPMLTTAEVAALLGTSGAAVRKLAQRGRLHSIRRGKGCRVLYDPFSVADEMRRRGRKTGGELTEPHPLVGRNIEVVRHFPD